MTSSLKSSHDTDSEYEEKEYNDSSSKDVVEKMKNMMRSEYDRRMEVMVNQAWPIIKAIYETHGQQYENVAVPVGDGKKIMQVLINLKRAYETKGKELIRAVSKTITLMTIDEAWKQHLRDMDDLKQSVQNATYEQKDPLLVYKLESADLFTELIEKISKEVVEFLMRAHIPLRENQPEVMNREARRKKTDMSNMRTSRNDLVTNGGEAKSNAPVRAEKKIGRNDPCPCGSGKKYKNCHGKNL